MVQEIKCPFCEQIIKIKIDIDSSGSPTAILIDNIHSPTVEELNKLGIELGVEEVK